METDFREHVYLAVPLLCLGAALVAGLFGRVIGRAGAHTVTILGVAVSFALSVFVFVDVQAGNAYNGAVYTWMVSDGVPFTIGFMIDELSATMMVVVTFVSLMVHVYTIGYMRDDPGYQRFFSYISLFTFSMLMLVMADNFLQLFFGWEAVGLVSYLLIGFWYERDSATFASLKAFLVNRVGDFGFLLGIAAVLYVFGTLDYDAVFAAAPHAADVKTEGFGVEWSWMTVICLLLFVGAMGKSAQIPLHVWLPDSMEGPTPISALIHAATMVTAGIFMVARMSPLYELSETALSVVLVTGALTAFFMALLGLVQNDIKRVVAYSTLSQLGYMTVALGASAYGAAIFHLGTHAFFKALLFLGAGSVIIAMHHEQDMRNMGGLRRVMPVTYWTMVVGSLALAGVPPFAGFFSKDAIIEAVRHSEIAGSGLAYYAVTAAVTVTAFYTFRLLFMTFHGEGRMDEHTRSGLRESPAVVTVPLVLLAIPSVLAGMWYVRPMLSGEHFGASLYVAAAHDGLARWRESLGDAGPVELILHAPFTPPLWLALGGIALAAWFYLVNPSLPARVASRLSLPYTVLVRKYGVDELYQAVFAGGGRALGGLFWRIGDVAVIDGFFVNGTARLFGWCAAAARHVQSGLVYHYAFAMIIGLLALMSWYLWN